MQPYSNDLRRRVIEAIEANEETQEEIGIRFSVSTSFVEKLWHRYRTTGSYEAKAHSGGRSRLLKDAEAVIRRLVRDEPDLTLLELAGRVAQETNLPPVSEPVMCVELQRLKLPLKKSRFTPPNETSSVFKEKEKNILWKVPR
jgi:transposase